MSLLSLYSACFVAGGIFVFLAAFAGLDGPEIDFDPGLDGAAGGESVDMDMAVGRDRRRRFPWLPFFTFRFWTFGACFFGLTGLLLTWVGADLSAQGILAIAIAMGLLCGLVVVWLLHWLKGQTATDSLVRADDFVGACGVVEIPFDANNRGKVCLEIKGTQVRLPARTQEEHSFATGDRVLVVGLGDRGVWVVSHQYLADAPTQQ